MKLFSSKYFGDFTLFDFEDCTGLTEILSSVCEYGNGMELFASTILSMLLIVIAFGIFQIIKDALHAEEEQ